ncbi:TrbI/VirB10 family protein [Microbulbifer sp. 2201CG32-9]|uniref:TrbI/VirB10 family protein n=1 Tax=Microbulbifer sp. 2201CG32-9 TaxID=3232309 RepID=UPI00345BC106
MSEAALQMDATPGGLEKLPKPKRLGKLPIVILSAVVITFVILLLIVVGTRQAQLNQENATTAEPEARKAESVVDSRMSVEELLADAPSGTIPEFVPQEERRLGEGDILVPAPRAAERAPLGSEAPAQHSDATPNRGGFQTADRPAERDPLELEERSLSDVQTGLGPLSEQEAARVRQVVNQRMETALFAPTTVQFETRSPGAQAGTQGQAGARTAVDPNRDVMSVYQARLAEIQRAQQSLAGGSAGFPGGFTPAGASSGGNNTNNGPGGFGQAPGDDWSLDAQRMGPKPYTLMSGGMIPAVMISGINSDLPGRVIAQISQNVYDTATGRELLLPQGSRLFGRYGSDNRVGDTRVALKWDRIIFPDGSSLNLDAMNGSDQEGYSGLKDEVNNHYFKIFSGAALLSLISAGYQIALGENDNNSGNTDNGLSAKEQIAVQMAQQMNQVGSELIRRNMRIQPTIVIRPGYKFIVMVNKDISFHGPYSPMDMELISGF